MFLLLLALQQSVADSSPFRQLALPSPTPVRGATGGPGPRYWQQRADYTLEATLDTATNMLRGRGRIYYVNRSPETLDYVWLQLDQNIFAPPHNSISRVLNLPPLLFAGGVVFEFCDFDVSLTVPAGFLVTATGMLANPSAVRSAQERTRLARAFTSPGQTAQVITRQEAIANTTRPVPGTKAWRFTASAVRDFAWAAGSGLRWDASTWDGILVQTFYHPDATPWEEANSMVRATLRHFSGALGQYPWPQVSAVEGLVEGMEYPMVIYCPSLQKREDQFWVLMHELGHQWFPMQVGSDERRYPWMDEGFNTFADYDAAEAFFKGTTYADTVRRELLAAYDATAIPGSEQPMITKPDEVRQLYWTAYQKPALMLSILREAVLGREEFDRGFREYVRRWKGKHPQPADFFRTMSNLTGRDLDWFWRNWIYTTARLDQAVDSVRSSADSAFLYLSNRGQMVLPVTPELRYADNSSAPRSRPV